jgi:hypothetical protein
LCSGMFARIKTAFQHNRANSTALHEVTIHFFFC